MTLAPEQTDWFTAHDISRAIGGNKKTIHRQAQREAWPQRQNGNRLEYQPPPHIAAVMIAPPRSDAQPDAPKVTFADLAHSDTQRAIVLLRQEAVELLKSNASMGKELALQLVCNHFAQKNPLFRISISSLRRWADAYAANGLDGLVEQKRGRVGRKSFAADLAPEHILQLAADAVGHGNWKRNNEIRRVNVAAGYRNLISNPTVEGPARQWLHGATASKSYVPPSVRRAVQASVSPLAATLLQVGPKAAKLDGAFSECSYGNVPAGRAFTADDMTANCYVWVEWPNEEGFLLVRPQILAAMDIGSMAWLNLRAVIRNKGQYNKDDVWGLIGDVLDGGLHINASGEVDMIAVLEGGTWQSGVVVGTKTNIDDDTRFGGLQSLGVKVIHTRTPRGKIIETAFNTLQHAADNVRGYCGRMEMKDCPEATKHALAQVKAGHAHPRQYFLHLNEYTDHLKGVMHALNHERNDGKILQGRAPVDKYAEDQPQFAVFPENSKWMYRAAYRVSEVTRNGVRVQVGSGKYATHYTYAHPALEIHRGRRVVVFWNDYNPDTPAVVYTLKGGKWDKLICVASRVPDLPRFGATEEQSAAEATRKKLQAQVAVTQSRALAPYLTRNHRPGGANVPASRNDVGEQIAAAREQQQESERTKSRVQRTVRNTELTAEDVSAATSSDEAEAPEAFSTEDISALFSEPGLHEENGKKVYVLDSASAGGDQAAYVDYLVERLTEFRKAGASFGQHYHAKVTPHITRAIAKKQLGCDLHDATRFDEICAHLKAKIDATILGKRNAAKGTANYHPFEEHTAEQPF